MRNGLDGFNRESFLQTGGLFGSGNTIWLFWGKLTKSKVRPHGPALLVARYFLDLEFDWWTFTNVLKVQRDELPKIFKGQIVDLSWEETSKTQFNKQFQRAQSWISSNELTKIVPYAMTYSPQQVEPEHLDSLIGSVAKKSQGFLYGVWELGQGMLGLSPELLVSQNSLEMKTMALAGTCTMDDFINNPEAFLQSHKDIKEHQIVVDDLTNCLSSFENFKKSERLIEKTPHLIHFKTEMSWSVTESDSLEAMIRLLHPTPALGCSPRKFVFSYMKKLNEMDERGRFGAPFGFSESQKRAEVIVAIRNLCWDEKGLQMGTGCGIVSESQIANEWMEVLNKKKSIKEIFNLL